MVGAHEEPACGTTYVVSLIEPADAGGFATIFPLDVSGEAGGEVLSAGDGLAPIRTGFLVEAGDLVRFDATGSVSIGGNPPNGPDGFPLAGAEGATFLLGDGASPTGEAADVAGALIARIGGGPFFYVGDQDPGTTVSTVTVPSTGEIELAINDILGGFSGNSGGFDVGLEPAIPGAYRIEVDGQVAIPLQFLKDDLGQPTLLWGAAALATTHNVYRGDFESNPADRDWAADGGVLTSKMVCLASDVSGTTLVDLSTPPSGEGHFYLVTGRNDLGEGALGVEEYMQVLVDAMLADGADLVDKKARFNDAPCSGGFNGFPDVDQDGDPQSLRQLPSRGEPEGGL